MDLRTTLKTPGAKHNLQFPRALREQFYNDCGFTDEEKEIIALRASGRSIIEIADIRHCSEESIHRRIRKIKDKIAAVI